MSELADFLHVFWGYEFRFSYSKFSSPLSHLCSHEAMDTNPWKSYTKLAPRAEVDRSEMTFFFCLAPAIILIYTALIFLTPSFLPLAGKQRFLLSPCILIFESPL